MRYIIPGKIKARYGFLVKVFSIRVGLSRLSRPFGKIIVHFIMPKTHGDIISSLSTNFMGRCTLVINLIFSTSFAKLSDSVI